MGGALTGCPPLYRRESPTGTGKTLCLLCAALAWRKSCKAKAQMAMQSGEMNLDPELAGIASLYGNFDMGLDHFSRDFKPYTTQQALCHPTRVVRHTGYSPQYSTLLYVGPMLIANWVLLAACDLIRCYDRFTGEIQAPEA